MAGIHIQQLQTRGVKPRGNHIRKAFHHLVAEVMVLFPFGAQSIRIEHECASV